MFLIQVGLVPLVSLAKKVTLVWLEVRVLLVALASLDVTEQKETEVDKFSFALYLLNEMKQEE